MTARKKTTPLPVDQTWFKARLAERKLSINQAAKHMKLDPGGLYRRLTGERRIKLEEAGQLAVLLGQPLALVLAHAGLDWKTVAHNSADVVPIAGTIDATHTITRGRTVGRVARPPQVPEGAEALVYQTAQTKADMVDGWILYATPASEGVEAECVGRLSVARLRDGREVVGFIRRGLGPGAYQIWDHTGLLINEAQLAACTPVLLIQP